jgi:cell division protease FtsH
VRRIVDEAHQQVMSLLRENRGKLDSLASALLEHETLDEEDAYAAAGVPRAETETANSYDAAARTRIDA